MQFGAVRPDGAHHPGVDIIATVGRKVYAANDGTLTVHSPPGAGTRLFMTLPERPDAPRSTL